MTDPHREQLQTAIGTAYQLDREIGAGGMATVWLAHDPKHQRVVAIKFLRNDVGEAVGEERFFREIRTTAALRHPHILPLFDSGRAGDRLYYVAPLIEGESLRARITRDGALPLTDALRLLREVTSALAYAHERGVVHRDIKPENILLGEGGAIVADFGIAKAQLPTAPTDLTPLGFVLGTPAYVAPEQAVGESIGPGADVYALGCVAYELLTGLPPFAGRSAQGLLAAHLMETPAALSSKRSDVSAELNELIAHCLAKEPSRRPADARELLTRLDALVLPTAQLPSTPARAAAVPTTGATERAVSIAVLPFTNLSASADDQYFSDGMTEDVIAQLSGVRSLKVISRTTVMRYRGTTKSAAEIAGELSVTHLLEGSVRRHGDRLRVVAQLIDGRDDRQVWAETLDRKLTDVFEVQSELAQHIAAALRTTLTDTERHRLVSRPTTDVETYNLYLLGRHHYNQVGPESFALACDYYRQAIARDPKFAPAYSALGSAQIYLGTGYWGVRPDDAYPEGERLARLALALDPDDGEAQCLLGTAAAWYRWDFETSRAALEAALKCNPNDGWTHSVRGHLLTLSGRFDAAKTALDRSIELDPSSPMLRLNAAMLAGMGGRPAEAISHGTVLHAMYPDTVIGEQVLAIGYLYGGRADLAVAPFRNAHQLAPSSFGALCLAFSLAMAKEERQAREILDALRTREATEYIWPMGFALSYAHLGETSRALDYLEEACDERVGWMLFIGVEPGFDVLRNEPRFQAVQRRVLGHAAP
ncbi:protein kinase domain-containing protein [Gemmatimonas groenlandica]|uniref:non-specific serine/threonine protein kinase n=1 Tax=Gemmatimonas groenlandica TaxID=2732249 RepID=A0A6M4ITD4_9BACT|nr:protein kinase [Gemmatimonas groenlandica]QJR37920.1 protein kinase [Gemmatimonas groenlandica]